MALTNDCGECVLMLRTGSDHLVVFTVHHKIGRRDLHCHVRHQKKGGVPTFVCNAVTTIDGALSDHYDKVRGLHMQTYQGESDVRVSLNFFGMDDVQMHLYDAKTCKYLSTHRFDSEDAEWLLKLFES